MEGVEAGSQPRYFQIPFRNATMVFGRLVGRAGTRYHEWLLGLGQQAKNQYHRLQW
jgi:hypothetical protein